MRQRGLPGILRQVIPGGVVLVVLLAGCASNGDSTTGTTAGDLSSTTSTTADPSTEATTTLPPLTGFAGDFRDLAGEEDWFGSVVSYGTIIDDVTVVFRADAAPDAPIFLATCELALEAHGPMASGTVLEVSTTENLVMARVDGPDGSCVILEPPEEMPPPEGEGE